MMFNAEPGFQKNMSRRIHCSDQDGIICLKQRFKNKDLKKFTNDMCFWNAAQEVRIPCQLTDAWTGSQPCRTGRHRSCDNWRLHALQSASQTSQRWGSTGTRSRHRWLDPSPSELDGTDSWTRRLCLPGRNLGITDREKDVLLWPWQKNGIIKNHRQRYINKPEYSQCTLRAEPTDHI